MEELGDGRGGGNVKVLDQENGTKTERSIGALEVGMRFGHVHGEGNQVVSQCLHDGQGGAGDDKALIYQISSKADDACCFKGNRVMCRG
jgi:hypothetical protein